MQSPFEGDTCAPPCWFGITPGVSTAADVETALDEQADDFHWSRTERSNNQFDPITGLITTGEYAIGWKNNNYLVYRIPTIISIKSGVVTTISATLNQDIRINKVLKILGTPDDIRMTPIEGPKFIINFIYISPPLELRFVEKYDGLDCTIETVPLHFQLAIMYYLTPAYAYEAGESEKQPNLLRISEGEKQVPVNIWQDWLDGKVEGDCGDAWYELPETFTFPELPTLTPVPSVTP